MKKAWLLFIVLSFVSGCASYKKPICDSTNYEDVPNFEGRFSLRYPESEDYTFSQKDFVVSRLARGNYNIEAQESLTVQSCEIAGQLYMEFLTMHSDNEGVDGYSAYRIQRQSDSTFDLTPMAADSAILRARGIPYQLIETPPQVPQKAHLTIGVNISKRLFADNSNIPTADFIQILEPVSAKITLTPLAPKKVNRLKPLK